ncbi:MAG TPA: DNA repair protein RadA [Candidatus Saccharibacteria bacterium]|nr:DNA repair protein RadA [Candidatus Saccharibacteria bacterium]
MAKKQQKLYLCSNCGDEFNVWAGKCQSCDQWNTLEEIIVDKSTRKNPKTSEITIVSTKDAIKNKEKRLQVGDVDLDKVLGGGLVKGGVVLIAGEPGIGKSTLLLQIADGSGKQAKVLYVSAEESIHQVGLRAARLGVDKNNISLSDETDVDTIAQTIDSKKFDLVIVDSIQTVSTSLLSSSSGSISQITSCTHLLIEASKRSNTALMIVGHVTKEGSIAGPKILEHIVDVVLQLEGDRHGGFKLLRSIKNRFGSTNEVAILEMVEKGLRVVENPSKELLKERQITDGSVVLATMEGTRPVLVEVQALVNKTSYGYPKRTSSGFDLNRLNLLIAVLEKRTKLNLSDKDIYINIVGGIKISENAADLAVCMAIGSAANGLKLSVNSVVFGEVGLSGEVRHVGNIDKRIEESNKMGFDQTIGPKPSSSTKPSHFIAKDLRLTLNHFLKV